ncbi:MULTISPECIES: hypothetical protein [unclassified Leptolyngbya]|uniref:hypothetical protein n=1 Tax=unclassified Leptolyngbya TaxID=2650499 RepID=UPI001683947B|nr:MULTISPECIES: hypothetical protein [unclassified Leptolyngbya]MBD1910664.1 hypothetical protein [Leptolyngbya sp. FACHB-8]MBD2158413.1 hypothetical protein [Leptolyngbya sp. FACHB-16]
MGCCDALLGGDRPLPGLLVVTLETFQNVLFFQILMDGELVKALYNGLLVRSPLAEPIGSSSFVHILLPSITLFLEKLTMSDARITALMQSLPEVIREKFAQFTISSKNDLTEDDLLSISTATFEEYLELGQIWYWLSELGEYGFSGLELCINGKRRCYLQSEGLPLLWRFVRLRPI